MFKHYSSLRTDREHMIDELENLSTKGCGKKSHLLQQCLKQVGEKGCIEIGCGGNVSVSRTGAERNQRPQLGAYYRLTGDSQAERMKTLSPWN